MNVYLGPQFYLIGVCNYFGTNNVLYFISMALCFDLNLGIVLFPTVFFLLMIALSLLDLFSSL